MKTDVVLASQESVKRRAVDVLSSGGLVAFPTDTVYGVAALPWDVDAVAQLYEAKKRPCSKPIPLLLSDAEYVDQVAQPTSVVERLAERFWPGGLTLVLRKKERVPDVVTPRPTVAVRIPDLPLARAIIREAGGVLAVTSANISGQPSPVTAEEVVRQLGGRIELVVDGGTCPGGVASTIVDCTTSPPRILRRGPISEGDIEAAASGSSLA